MPSSQNESLPPELEQHLRWLLAAATTERPDPDGVCIACRQLRERGFIVHSEEDSWAALDLWEMV